VTKFSPESTESPSDLGEVLSFMQTIWELDHQLQSRSKRMAASLGVTGRQRLVIRILGRFPSIPAGRLAELLKVHPSTLTGVLQRLDQRGLVVRSRDPADARRAVLSLSPKGRALNGRTSGTVEAAVRRVLERAPPRTIELARALLTDLSAELAKGG
jgi:DNA-binding MarR family transcriptional regulator